MKIVIRMDDQILSATLNNSAAARDFAALLPLKLTLEDYAKTEKIANLPGRLSTADSPAGTSAQAGDITYYAPWGNLAIFYKPFGFAAGLVTLGKLDRGAQGMNFSGLKNVVIEAAERGVNS